MRVPDRLKITVVFDEINVKSVSLSMWYNDCFFRRRYTDSRHPTTELPDVRAGVPDLPSVRDPPVRNKSKSKEVLDEDNVTQSDVDSDQKRSPNIADRPSYKRWQQSAKSNSDSDSHG